MSVTQLSEFKDSLRKLVVDNYSWEGIAGKYLKTYLG
jgi:glycosyltransferase involved in cell wall biosynthesis